MIEPTELDVSGERFSATYEFHGDPAIAEERARALCVEQTIEFPADLVPDDDISRQVIGRIESIATNNDTITTAVVSYAVETTGFELPQLLNVLWGNSSILPGIRLADVSFPPLLLSHFAGPQFGIAGLRQLFAAPRRPLLATALKPMGLPPERLADQAYRFALGGIDIVKDDHSLSNQPFAPFEERVTACAEAVHRANSETGYRCVYMPSINAPSDQVDRRVQFALDAGVGALLVLPGIGGFDQVRHLRQIVEVPLMSHPALLGSFSTSPTGGIGHGIVYGTLMRLAGADLAVFPTYGGRFSFTQHECRQIGDALSAPLGELATGCPAPGGGMTLDRVTEVLDFYGPDVALLIGGDLHRGEDLTATAAAFRAAVER